MYTKIAPCIMRDYKIFFKEREETIMKTLKTLKNALSYALGYVTVLGIAVLLSGLRKFRLLFFLA